MDALSYAIFIFFGLGFILFALEEKGYISPGLTGEIMATIFLLGLGLGMLILL